eukprot:4998309-Pleurochrysis_carterae.AAC.1
MLNCAAPLRLATLHRCASPRCTAAPRHAAPLLRYASRSPSADCAAQKTRMYPNYKEGCCIRASSSATL